MVFGFDEPRPRAEDYEMFLNGFCKSIARVDPDITLMIYGSYVRGDYIPGVSDIDAVLSFPDDVVIDKAKLFDAGIALQYALEHNKIDFQVTVTDRTTMRDGRFSAYNPTFESYFKDEGVVLGGPDRHGEWRFPMPTHPEQSPLQFNLRKARNGFLFAPYCAEHDRTKLVERFDKTLKAVSRGSKQLLFMADGELRKNRFSALESIEEMFEVDPAPLEHIKQLYHNPHILDTLYQEPMRMIDEWAQSLSFFEELIKAYIKKHPANEKQEKYQETPA